MSRGTPHRTIRIPDEIWWAAKEKADADGQHLSDIIRGALRAYILNSYLDDSRNAISTPGHHAAVKDLPPKFRF